MRTRRSLLAFTPLALAAALGGCVVAPAYPRYGGYGGPGGYGSRGGYDGRDGGYDDGVIAAAPPQPRYEVIGVAPYPGWFWIGGFWTWRANRHVWVDGHWQEPRRGYRWQPHRWEPISGGRGWRESPGRWNH